MMRQKPRPFEELAAEITNSTILLDVDGTLLPDGADILSPLTLDVVRNLARENTVYLVSNGTNRERVERFARECGVSVAPRGVPAGKPRVRAAEGIPRDKPLVVIGDKVLTDGLFARFLGAHFIMVESHRGGAESPLVKLWYVLDKAVSWFL